MAVASRPYTIEEYTRSVCPHCLARGGVRSDDPDVFVDAMLVSHSGSIWMRRFCREHGETESLYEEDANLWRSRAGWQTPTLSVVPDRADNFRGFPAGYRDGLPAGHGQHSCILLLNLTEHCNYKCPTCYATALEPGTPALAEEKPTLSELLHTVDTVIEREGGKLSVVMLSGGEPTLRRDFETLVEELLERKITRILVNTNGRRILKDKAFLRFLASHRDRVEVYLQFDGLSDRVYLDLRGEALADEKRKTLELLNQERIFTTLVATVKRGVNESEMQALLELGLNTPYCSGLAIQPVFGSGRNSGIDPMKRTTPTGVLRAMDRATDFIPLPCSHKDCCDIAYFVKNEKGEWNSLVSLVGRDELKKWVHLASNSISFENVQDSLRLMIQDGTLQRLLSEQQRASSLQVASDLFRMCDCVPGLTDLMGGIWKAFGGEDRLLDRMAMRTFRVTVKMFMDAHTFHEARIRQCCVHVGTFEEDPRRYSFCWRWLFADAQDFPDRVSTLRVL
ncbi:MAG: radical SAM protein [Armatimonadetes bacterium]|nr:radical SAM protein [Armatimonadota bacterium]